ncbi:hypothetical protein EDB19DRAFT_1687576 [Suillus lakei]|nr:hypothetical protein EDB19DRAFT_1687576 [Suillus lakei]
MIYKLATMIGQFDTYQSPVFFSPPNYGIPASLGQGFIDAQGAPGPLLRCAANQWVSYTPKNSRWLLIYHWQAELKARFLSVHAREMPGTLSSPTYYLSSQRSKRPLRSRPQNTQFWTLEDRMKRIQSRATFRRRSASQNRFQRSTMPDLKVLHTHYARQHMHGEAYDQYECGQSSPKRKRAVIGIRNENKPTREILPFVRPRNSYQCSFDERQPQWSPDVEGLVDSQINVIVDHEMADVRDESWFQSNATSGLSISADSTSTKRVLDGVSRIFEKAMASKKTTDPRRRPRPAMVDIDMIADLPSASHHRPCRDIYQAGHIGRNESSGGIKASEPMQTTADLMRETFGDGEADDADSVVSMIRYMNIL